MRWLQFASIVLSAAMLSVHPPQEKQDEQMTLTSSKAPTWTWPGRTEEDLRQHMRAHGVNVEGKTFEELRAGHDYIHNATRRGTPDPNDYKILAQCRNGQCPPGWRFGGGIYVGPSFPQPQPMKTADSDWPGGMAKIRVRHGQFIDEGSAVCVGNGRTANEWIFLTCAHNLESGQTPELNIRGQWVAASVLYRDKLAPVVNGIRTKDGPDRAVVSVMFPQKLKFRRVSALWTSGPVALAGYPSTNSPVTILGTARVTRSGLRVRAELRRASRGGFSGGGLFSANKELVGIWTSGKDGTGYAESIEGFIAVFDKIGWKPGVWAHVPFPPDDTVVEGDTDDTVVVAPGEPTVDRDALCDRLKRLEVLVASFSCKDGADGKDGKRGADGSDGADGKDGIGIASARIDEGDLILVLTNGDELSAGSVVPKDDWKRRVLMVDGKTETVIADEWYGKDEPILIDVNNLKKK